MANLAPLGSCGGTSTQFRSAGVIILCWPACSPPDVANRGMTTAPTASTARTIALLIDRMLMVQARSIRRCRQEIGRASEIEARRYFAGWAKGAKLNFCPPTLASYIRPPLAAVNTATPFWNLALADAPDLSATAL